MPDRTRRGRFNGRRGCCDRQGQWVGYGQQREAAIVLRALQAAPCRVRGRPMHGTCTMIGAVRARADDVRRATAGCEQNGRARQDQGVDEQPHDGNLDEETSDLQHVPVQLSHISWMDQGGVGPRIDLPWIALLVGQAGMWYMWVIRDGAASPSPTPPLPGSPPRRSAGSPVSSAAGATLLCCRKPWVPCEPARREPVHREAPMQGLSVVGGFADAAWRAVLQNVVRQLRIPPLFSPRTTRPGYTRAAARYEVDILEPADLW
jgi:hypothetical protein